MSEETLTARQFEVLSFLNEFIQENGYPPTLKEVGAYFGIHNPNAIRNHLLALEKKGYISKGADRSRALRITRRPRGLAKAVAGLKERIRRHRGVLYALEYHLALATRKGRQHLVGEVGEEVRAKIEQVVTDHGWELLELEVNPDHVLASIRPGPDHSPERVVRNLKNATTAVWLRHPILISGRGLWSHGFLATTRAEDRDALIDDFLAEKREANDEADEGGADLDDASPDGEADTPNGGNQE